MPFYVQDLLKDKQKPVSVKLSDSAKMAFDLMAKHDFSQLPVVDDDSKPQGLVTSDSILAAMINLNLNIDELKIIHAKQNVHRYYPLGYGIFELIDESNRYSAVLIVDLEGKLHGIITNWDTAEYFRERAADIMLIDNLESHLKDYIRKVFTYHENHTGESLLEAAINEITSASDRDLKEIKASLYRYMNSIGSEHKIDESQLEKAFSKTPKKSDKNKSLDDLTLYEYTRLILYKPIWENYGQSYFEIPAKSLDSLLEKVRDSRNALAHFRREIDARERQAIKLCLSLMQKISPILSQEIPNANIAVLEKPIIESDRLVVKEEVSADDNNIYALLAIYLQNQPIENTSIQKTFKEVEEILGNQLPSSAYEYRNWWANDSVSNIQSEEWVKSGWRVSSVNMSEKTVVFSRNQELQEKYITFFSQLLSEINKHGEFTKDSYSPNGSHWISIKSFPRIGRKQAWFTVSFTRQKQFRVELYIDTKDRDMNKKIFDMLYNQRQIIEAELSGTLNWERLDTKQASRIASYRQESTINNPEDYPQIISWVIDELTKFERVLSGRVEEAIRKTSKSEGQ